MPNTKELRSIRANPDKVETLVRREIECTLDSTQTDVLDAVPTSEWVQRLVESMNRLSSVQQRLEVLLHTALTAVPQAQQGILYLRTADSRVFMISAAYPNEPDLVGSKVEAQGGYVGAVAQVQYPVLIADAREEGLVAYRTSTPTPRAARSALVAPFVVGGRTIGVLALENHERPAAFVQQDLDFVSHLAQQTALAVDHCRLVSAIALRLPGCHPELAVWREMADRIPTGLVVIAPHRRNVWANAAFFRMAGFPADEIQGNWARFSDIFGQDLSALCPRSDHEPISMSLVGRDGTRFPVRATFDRLNERGIHGPESYLGIIEDLSNQEEMERKLFHMQRLSNVGALLSAISHELNNPLTAVVGFSELILSREDIPPEVREDLATIVRQAERSVRVARDLLDYVRLKNDGPTQFDINHIIRQLVRFRMRALRHDDVEIVLSLADHIPTLVGEARQLQQVLLNLIDNAEQATKITNRPGKLWIRTRFIEQEGYVRISVRDNGPGIPPEIKSRIFEPFFTTKPSGQGTGLGLSISKQIVERHKGRIWAESKPGRGATFYVDLPASTRPSHKPADRDTLCAKPASKPARILVVDDEKSIRDLLARILTRDGHRVEVAWSGSQAIHKLEETAYDIVFLDLKIPGLSGQAVYAWIKHDRPELARQTVILTGDTLGNETLSFLREERVRHLLKPFQVADLRNALREVWPG